MAAERESGDLIPEGQETIARLGDENALLRAALAETRARLEELEEVADTDPLTGIANRRHFLRALERAVSQAERHDTPAALLSLDLHGLSSINERHGHAAADAALIHVARLLKSLIRSSDFVGRIGGDAFGLILDHLDHRSAIDTADRIARCIARNPLDIGTGSVRLEASIGVAAILKGDSAEDALRRADRNLERMKDF